MKNGKWLVAGLLELLLLLAAPLGAQEPKRPDLKPPAGSNDGASLVDPKAFADRKAAATAAALLESAYEGRQPPEGVRMLAAILRGSQMGPGEGWFGPCNTRYTWKWLAERCGVDPAKGVILRAQFKGPDASFACLDRNKDGVITVDDLDWSDRNPYVQMSSMANRLFRKLNAQKNGRLTKEELLQFFDKAAEGKDHLCSDDFRDALLAGVFGGFQPSDVPRPAVLIRGLFSGDPGSMSEGPELNEQAPDFTLKSADGKNTVQLAKRIGSKPIILIFGSFT